MDVRITLNDKNNPPGKLADAEIHFTDGVLAGLKLIGFAIWERRTGGGRNVTFPARQYSVNGERRSFSLLRPVTGDATAQDRLRELVLQAYAEYRGARRRHDLNSTPNFLFPTTNHSRIPSLNNSRLGLVVGGWEGVGNWALGVNG